MMCDCNPLVSVIIPNYCHAKYFEQRIESVLGQTYQNFEVIILDDASPDGGASMAVIEKYRGNPHVSYIEYNNENSGSTFKQWRKGLELAKGELIWIAESDDYCELNFIETLVDEFINDDRCVLAFVKSLGIDGDGKPINSRSDDDSVERLDGLKFVQKYLSFGNGIQNASSAIFKKSIALSVDDEYMKYRGAGDQLFWIEVSLNGNVVFVHNQLNYFRFHDANVTKTLYSNGQTLKELHNIYLYQCEHNLFVSTWMRYYIRHQFILWIDEKVEDKRIKEDLQRLWDPHGTEWIVGLLIKIRNFF